MENLWVEDVSRKHVLTKGNVLSRKALSLYKDLREGSPKMVTPSHLLQVRDGYTDLGISLDWKCKNYWRSCCHISSRGEETDWGRIPPTASLQTVMKPGSSGRRCPIEPTFIKMQKRRDQHEDRLTLVLGGSTAGHMKKPGIEYSAKNSCALKNKSKNDMPVFWQRN